MVMQNYVCQTAAEDEKILALFSFTVFIIIVHRRLYVPNIVTSGFYPGNFSIENRSNFQKEISAI